MRKFIFNISIFIIIPTIIFLSFDVFVSNKLKSKIDFPAENEVWNDIYSSSINANIAILGSSRAWVHFNPKIIDSILNENSYNFGEDGANFILQYIRYKEYIANNPSPKLVVISLDLWTLKKNDNGYPTNRYYPYMLGNTRVYNFLEGIGKVGYNKNKFFIPSLRYLNLSQINKLLSSQEQPYFELFNKHLKLRNGRLRYKGFRGMDLQWKNKNSFLGSEFEIEVDNSIISNLESFLIELKKNKIKVVLVYPPEFKDGQSLATNRGNIFSIYKNVSEKFNLPFYDYSDHDLSFNKELFYNVQHLNDIGANKFTNDFAMKIKDTFFD